MNKYQILEITTSYREDIVKNDPVDSGDQLTRSTINCYLVAHALYKFGVNNEIGHADADIYKIATKSYDSDGNIKVTPGSSEIPSHDEVVELLNEVIESQIDSVIQEDIYRQLIRKATSTAELTINSYERDSKTGLESVNS